MCKHRNRQPFYHRIDGILFTAVRAIPEEEFLDALRTALNEVQGVVS